MASPALPWTGKVPYGFGAYVAKQTGLKNQVVNMVLAGTKTSARIEAYICGALGLPLPVRDVSPLSDPDDAPTPLAPRPRGRRTTT